MKFIITLLSLMILSVSCIEDEDAANNSGWEKEWGGSVFGLHAITIGYNDTIYIGGDVDASVDWNYMITAFTSGGEKIFDKFGEVKGIVYALVADSSGNVYAGGTEGSQGLLMKLSKNGDVLWKNTLNDEESGAEAYAVALDKDENIYVADNAMSGAKGNITKFSSEGKELWHHNISTEDAEGQINALAVDSEGNVYAGGKTGYNLFGENAGGTDAFLVKIAPDKTHVWEKQWGGRGDDRAYSLAVDNMNNIYVAGGTFREAEVLAKYSSEGTRLWGHTGKSIHYLSIVIDSENNIYCGSGGNNNLVYKYSSDGNEIWNTNDAGEWDWGATGIALDSYGNLYVCGGSEENHLIKIPASEME